MFAVGYSYERFKNRKHVYSFDAGLMVIYMLPRSVETIGRRVYGTEVTHNGAPVVFDPATDTVLWNFPNLLYIKWAWMWPF